MLLRAIVLVIALYAIYVAILVLFEDRLVFHPITPAEKWRDPPTGFACEELTLGTSTGVSMGARWFPCLDATGAVLICHSKTGNVSLECDRDFLEGWHRSIGVSLLIFDYPGYGKSDGIPSEAGCYAAADAAHAWLVDNQRIPPEQVLIFGRSLGTGVAVELASRCRHRALILIAPYTSLPDVAVRRYGALPAPLLMHNRFRSVDRIAKCTGPTFILHGTEDHVVPFALGQALFEAANEPKRFVRVEGGHHGGTLMDGFFPALRDFLADVE